MYSDCGTAVAESLASTRFSFPLDCTGLTLKTAPCGAPAPAAGVPERAPTQAGDSDDGEDGAGEAAARHEDSWRTTVANPATLRRVTAAGKTADG